MNQNLVSGLVAPPFLLQGGVRRETKLSQLLGHIADLGTENKTSQLRGFKQALVFGLTHVATLVDLLKPPKLLPECKRRLGRQDKSPACEKQGLTESIGQPELTIRKEARSLGELTTFSCVHCRVRGGPEPQHQTVPQPAHACGPDTRSGP